MDELVTWLRRRIAERKYLAEHAIELGSFAEWEERSSGVLVTGDGTDSDPWRGTWVTGDSSVTRLMEANDPQDTIARCEAELAILDEHRLVIADRGEGAHPGYRVVNENPDAAAIDNARRHSDIDCRTCRVRYPCRTVRLLARGYRNRPGYQEEAWRP